MYSKPTVANVTLTSAATEYSYAIPANTKKILAKARGSNALRFAFVSGETTTNYVSIAAGGQFSLDSVYLRGQTLYVQCPGAAGEVLEILTFQDQ